MNFCAQGIMMINKNICLTCRHTLSHWYFIEVTFWVAVHTDSRSLDAHAIPNWNWSIPIYLPHFRHTAWIAVCIHTHWPWTCVSNGRRSYNLLLLSDTRLCVKGRSFMEKQQCLLLYLCIYLCCYIKCDRCILMHAYCNKSDS